MPALDGVRGVAILLVLASHLRLPGSGASGAVGVVVFFALSGFLITTLLLERPAMGRFYERRARRLLPALGACLVLTFVLQVAIAGGVQDWPLIAGALTYSSDWVQAAGAYTQGSALGHLWSLAVEEQFYILWPVLLLGLRRYPRRWMMAAISVLILLSWYTRATYYSGHSWAFAYHMPEGRADELLVGCLLAVALHGRTVRALPGWLVVPPLAGIVGLSYAGGMVGLVVMPTLAAAATAAILFVAVGGRAVGLDHPVLRWFGLRSYALYLYHLPLRWAFDQSGLPGWVAMSATLAVSLLLAEASWRYLEQPFLRGGSDQAVQREPRADREVAAARQV